MAGQRSKARTPSNKKREVDDFNKTQTKRAKGTLTMAESPLDKTGENDNEQVYGDNDNGDETYHEDGKGLNKDHDEEEEDDNDEEDENDSQAQSEKKSESGEEGKVAGDVVAQKKEGHSNLECNNIEGHVKRDNVDGENRDESNTDATDQSRTENKGTCDICSKPAHSREFLGQLQKCKDCGICIHELCYCLVLTTEVDPNFTCHACKAVNTTIEVNNPSKIGGCGDKMGKKRDLMTVEERPMECVLCLHSSGYHAMHPLYDTWGKEGRQYVLKPTRSGIGGKPRRLAWVHTLCAQMLIQTKGYLYGVDEDGDWHGCTKDDDGDNNADDDETENISSSDDSDEEVGGQKYCLGTRIYKEFYDEDSDELRFFEGKVKRFDTKAKLYKVVYEDGDTEEMTESEIKKYLHKPIEADTKTETEPISVATRNFCINEDMKEEIKQARKLKCVICCRSDEGTLRIPTQCNAGDKGVHVELEQLLGNHVKDSCMKAMHVGCARWNAADHYALVAGNKRLRMTYFYPGRYSGETSGDKEYPDPVANCFCRNHAKIIQETRAKGA